MRCVAAPWRDPAQLVPRSPDVPDSTRPDPQERNTSHPDGGPEASRMTATARRKIGTLGTQIERSFQWLDSAAAAGVSEQEKYRRRDLLHALKSRREQLQVALKRNQQQAASRDGLLAGSSAGRVAAIETEATAALDNRGLLSMQQQVMQQQDQELDFMEKTINSTKHIALTIGEPGRWRAALARAATFAALREGAYVAGQAPLPLAHPPGLPPCRRPPPCASGALTRPASGQQPRLRWWM
jgi:hypothetical protein